MASKNDSTTCLVLAIALIIASTLFYSPLIVAATMKHMNMANCGDSDACFDMPPFELRMTPSGLTNLRPQRALTPSPSGWNTQSFQPEGTSDRSTRTHSCYSRDGEAPSSVQGSRKRL